MRLFAIVVAIAVSAVTFAQESPSFNRLTATVSNWKTQAGTHLSVENADLETHKYKRCIKLNNYWCLKDVGWEGRLGKDSDDHTAFWNGFYSARAAVRNFRTAFFKHGRKSALAIMSVYAPPDDCIGSKAGSRSDGTCIWGKNPTDKYARSVAKGITDDINADLVLFSADGKATDALVTFLANMSAFELGGMTVIEPTIRKGICLEDGTCSLGAQHCAPADRP